MSQGKIITTILGALAVLIAVLVFLTKGDLYEKSQLNSEAIFAVLDDGEEIKTYTMSDIAGLGEVTFEATLKSSGKDPESHQYTGVLLKAILEDAGLPPSEGDNAVVSAIDGYVVGISNEKLMDEANVYLCYKRDGDLIGTREEGGDGPYQLVISKDKFSQYWCKYAYSVALQ